MENCNVFVNDESWNGYALVEGVLIAVKAESIDISQTTRGKRIRINCTDGKGKYRVHPENYYDSVKDFEHENPSQMRECPIAGKIKNIQYNREDDTWSAYAIGSDGLPVKKEFALRSIQCSLERHNCFKVTSSEIKEQLYWNYEEAIQSTTYTSIEPDGTEKTHVGLIKLLKPNDEQQALLQELNNTLGKLYAAGVKLVRRDDSKWFALNTKDVQEVRVVDEWSCNDDFNKRPDEEEVCREGQLEYDLDFSSVNECSQGLFNIYVKR